MESVRLSFGQRGSMLFSTANVLQLVGWTAVMVFYGAQVSAALGAGLFAEDSYLLWALAIGALIVVWLLAGAREKCDIAYADLVGARMLVQRAKAPEIVRQGRFGRAAFIRFWPAARFSSTRHCPRCRRGDGG